MDELNPTIINRLRGMAKAGDPPSRMLRAVIDQLAPDLPHKVTLINYMREAFQLSLQQATPMAGWAPDGSADLSDSQLDSFVAPEIARNRPKWEVLEAA